MIIITSPPERFYGELKVPGDKSITHRAVMLGSLARGVTEIRDYLDAEDCRSTIECMRRLGVNIAFRGDRLLIEGRDMKMKQPAQILDAGNSGTTARLLLGILAGQSFEANLTGDQSLQKRPMKRVVEPLRLMGADVKGSGERLPLVIKGGALKAITYKMPVASAQLKSALLLAALFAEGTTILEEPYPSRDHTELLLEQFGAEVEVDQNRVNLSGGQVLRGCPIRVPGDISAAAFFMVAAAIIPGAEVLLKKVDLNPTRSGIIDILTSMGANIEVKEKKLWGKEPVADILVRGGKPLRAVTIGGEIIPRLIDELPVIAVAATAAEGETVIRDAAELRVKESDRISALAGQLRAMGARITETKDGMIIEGGVRLKGANLDSCGDHRIAMALAVAGLVAEGETAVDGAEAIAISYPGFMQDLRSLVD